METDATSMLKPLQLNGALLEMKRAETIEKVVISLMRLLMTMAVELELGDASTYMSVDSLQEAISSWQLTALQQ